MNLYKMYFDTVDINMDIIIDFDLDNNIVLMPKYYFVYSNEI